MSKIKYQNPNYSDGIPEMVGDRFYAQDLARNFHSGLDFLGTAMESIIGDTPMLIRGGVCTKGTNYDDMDIERSFGIVAYEVETPDNFSSLPPSTQNEDIKAMIVEGDQQVNLNLNTTGILDGTTTNYVKLRYKELDGGSRSRAKKAGDYVYEKEPSYEIVINDTANTDYDILLCTFIGDGSSFLTITGVEQAFPEYSSNVASLRLNPGYIDGQEMKVKGYYEDGDVLMPTYYWDASSDLDDNGGSIIKPDDTEDLGRWVWGESSEINVKCFGAKGIGLTFDDTDAFENAIAVSKDVIAKNGDFNISKLLDASIIADDKTSWANRMQFASTTKNAKALGSIAIHAELPEKGANYDSLISTYSYSYIYPQGVVINAERREIFVYGASVGGDNSWGWIWVYDLDTLAHKAVFSAGNNNSEGLHIYNSTSDYLFTGYTYHSDGTGVSAVYILPEDVTTIDMTRLTEESTANLGQVFKISGFGNRLIVELNDSYGSRRNVAYYDCSDVIASENPTPEGYATLDAQVYEAGKSQAYALSPDGLLLSTGGSYYSGSGDYTATQQQNFVLMDTRGNVQKSSRYNPNTVRLALDPYTKNTTTRMENEGASILKINGDNKLLTAMVVNSSGDVGSDIGGIVIAEIDIDGSLGYAINLDSGFQNKGVTSNGTIAKFLAHYNSINPQTGKSLSTWSDMLDMMKATGSQYYSYYNWSGSDVTDINGDNVQATCMVTFTTGNFFTYMVHVVGNNIDYHCRIVDSDPYVQDMGLWVHASNSTLRDEFLGRRMVVGKDGFPSIDYYSNKDTNQTAMRFYTGINDGGGTISLKGNIGFSSAGTTYTTTSDPRVKTEFEEHLDPWGDFDKIFESFGQFEFKDNLGTKILGFNAHKLIDTGIGAGVEGEGPRDLEIGEKYGEEEVLDGSGNPEKDEDGNVIMRDLIVSEASVDQSKIVPYLVSVINDLRERLETVEGKI